ncbi:MAG: hypothetical protein N3B18_03705 [Desulfobacterota bacterium]|nr:hypothetical protein [Thermodesulfobacteriota bacterium]
MKIPQENIIRIDRPDMMETFADSLGMLLFDGQVARLEFCVTRLDPQSTPQTPSAHRYPSCRLVLTPEAFLDLYNQLQKLMSAMERDGLVHKIRQNIKEPLH